MQEEVNLTAKPIGEQDWLSRLETGEAGVRWEAAIKFRAGLLGCVAHGSMGYLKPGQYRLTLELRSGPNRLAGYDACVLIEIMSCSRLIAVHVLSRANLRKTTHELVFDVPEQATVTELRVSALSSVEATIHKVGVDSLAGAPERPVSRVFRLQNWLPLLHVGPAGRRPEFGAEAEQGVTEALEGCSGYVVCGPRWPLAPGRYKMTAVIEPSKADTESGAIGWLDVAADTTAIASAEIKANQTTRDPPVLVFEVAQPASNGFPSLINTRIFSQGTRGFRVRSIKIELEQRASPAGIKLGLGNFLARTIALLSRPLKRATARSVGPLEDKLEATIARQIEQSEARQHQLNAAVISRLDGIENGAADCRRAIQAVAEQQREAGEGVGRRMERLEGQASRQEQAIHVVAEQQRQVSASVDERLEQTYKHISALIDDWLQKLVALSEQKNNHVRALQASIAQTQEQFNDVMQKVESLNERVEKLPIFQTLKGLGIEDHLLESYGSAPPLHPIGDWHVGTGIDNPTNLHKDRVKKWNALTQPALLVWHADLKVMLWPGNENSRALFITGNFEPSEMSWLAGNLKDDMVFIDVGANMGIYTMFAAKLVGAGGRVMAIEPSEREFQRLSFHVILNDLSNVTCLRFAAADKMGVGKLKVAGEEKSGQNTLGKFVSESTEVLRVETVQMYPLDRVVAEHELERVDVIKIDVEGAELRVLRGLTSTIESWRPKLLIELAPEALAGQNTSPEALVEWLRDRGYELFEFSRTTGALKKFQGASAERSSKNFVAIPAK